MQKEAQSQQHVSSEMSKNIHEDIDAIKRKLELELEMAQRQLKKGYRVVRHQTRLHPEKAIAISFVAGLCVGALFTALLDD